MNPTVEGGDRATYDEDWSWLHMAAPAPGAAGPGESPFPPLGEYGSLSAGETPALVARSGNVEWLCLPRIDSPSVFGAILDRSAGGFRLGPADVLLPARPLDLP